MISFLMIKMQHLQESRMIKKTTKKNIEFGVEKNKTEYVGKIKLDFIYRALKMLGKTNGNMSTCNKTTNLKQVDI